MQSYLIRQYPPNNLTKILIISEKIFMLIVGKNIVLLVRKMGYEKARVGKIKLTVGELRGFQQQCSLRKS